MKLITHLITLNLIGDNMKLIIGTDSLYEKLRQEPSSSPQDMFFLEAARQIRAGEEWKTEPQEKQPQQPIFIRGDEVQLPFPFKSARLYLTRTGEVYNAAFHSLLPDFTYNNKKLDEVAKAICPEMEKLYAEKCAAISDYGGYILDEDCRTVIAFGLSNDLHYNISIGQDGTEARSFRGIEGFVEDMTIFGTAVNNVVNSGVDSAVKLGHLKSNPQLRLILR